MKELKFILYPGGRASDVYLFDCNVFWLATASLRFVVEIPAVLVSFVVKVFRLIHRTECPCVLSVIR